MPTSALPSLMTPDLVELILVLSGLVGVCALVAWLYLVWRGDR